MSPNFPFFKQRDTNMRKRGVNSEVIGLVKV